MTAIIPVFNGAPYVAEAVRSVLGQTHRELECIVVDDGSTDGTPMIVEDIDDPRLRLLRQANGGVAKARNAGLRAAAGEAIAFLDADDVWLPDKIGRQAEVLQAAPPVGLVYTGFRVVDEALRPKYDVLPSPWTQRVRGALQLDGFGIGFSFTGMVARSAVAAVGLFDERISTSADAEYAWRLSRRFEAVGIDKPLALYRQHARSQMHEDLDALEHDLTLVLTEAEVDADFRDRGLANLHTHLAVRRALRGDLGRAARHAVAAARIEPARLVGLPLNAARRRAVRRMFGRWPARSEQCESVVR